MLGAFFLREIVKNPQVLKNKLAFEALQLDDRIMIVYFFIRVLSFVSAVLILEKCEPFLIVVY